jgi:hypothetical protein
LTGKVAAPVKKTELTTGGIRCADHATPFIRKKLALTSPTSGGRSVGIVRLRTKSLSVCSSHMLTHITLCPVSYTVILQNAIFHVIHVCSRTVEVSGPV